MPSARSGGLISRAVTLACTSHAPDTQASVSELSNLILYERAAMPSRKASHDSGRRHERVKSELRKLARSLEPGSALPPRSELVHQLRVARATLTRAVQQLETEGILTIRPRVGLYTTERARLLNVAFAQYWEPYNLDSFDLALMAALTRNGPDYGLFVEVHMLGTYEQPDKDRLAAFHRLVAARRYVGILSMTSRPISGWRADLEKLGLPLAFNPVIIDPSSLEELGVSLLCRRGCGRIAMLNHIESPDAAGERRYRQALQNHSLPYQPEWYVLIPDELPWELAGYRHFRSAWEKWTRKPDGVVSSNDHVTQGMLRAAQDMGINIPGELQIATHANRGLSQFTHPDIVRLEVDVQRMAQMMLEKMRDKIKGDRDKTSAIIKLIPAEETKQYES